MQKVIGENTYDIGKLDVMRQFHVARRLAPAVWALARSAGEVVKKALPEGVPLSLKGVLGCLQGLEDDALLGAVISSAEPLVNVLAHMNDADCQFIIDECLSVCSRQCDGGWQVVSVPGSGIIFHDLQLPEMLQLVLAAVRENLGNFTPAPVTQP